MDYNALARELGISGNLRGEELIGRCPLHQDRNPSFSINMKSGLWICYSGCGQGDFLHLMMRMLDISYQEAFARVRNKKSVVGLDTLNKELGELFKDQEQPESETDYWVQYYHLTQSNLMANWFLDRGFTWEMIFSWGIKYDQVLDAVLIPVEENENIVGVVVRYGSGEPKYVNSPPLEKSKVLFGRSLTGSRSIMLVEGPLDAIWSYEHGVGAYSLLGATIGHRQIELLKARRFGEIVLGFDKDETGRKATDEVARQLVAAGYLYPQITVIEWPDGCKDAQNCTPEQLKTAYLMRHTYEFF